MTHTIASNTSTATRPRSAVGRAGVALAFASPILIVLGALGSKFGLFGPRIGFMTLTLGLAPLAAALGFGLGLVALIMSLLAKPRGALRSPSVAVALGGLLLAIYAAMAASAGKSPPIHDVATEWSEPLMPSSAVMDLRGAGANPVEPDPVVPAGRLAKAFAGQRIAEINTRTCPAATPVTLAVPVDQAFTKARDVLKAAGLQLVSDDVRSGRLEAVSTSFWYRFKDDVIVRVRPESAGSRIDLRSISRVGVSDLGQNCARVTKLRAALAG